MSSLLAPGRNQQDQVKQTFLGTRRLCLGGPLPPLKNITILCGCAGIKDKHIVTH